MLRCAARGFRCPAGAPTVSLGSVSPMFFQQSPVESMRLLGLLANQAAPGPELTPFQQLLNSPLTLIAGMMALFYFIMLVPERKRKAEEAAKLASIQKNDRIVTIGGIHGVVASINDDDTLTIRIDESGNARMKIDRKAVSRLLREKDSAKAPEPTT